jgi:hypothetical protein
MSDVLKSVLWVLPVSALVITAIAVFGQWRLGKHRGLSREEFIRACGEGATSPEIPGVVYDYYKSLVFSKDFSVTPDDTYADVLSKGDEDIQDDAVVLLKKLRISDPSKYVAQVPEAKLRTIRDMVQWLEAVRTGSGAG